MKIVQAPPIKSQEIDFLTLKINEETLNFGLVAPFAFFVKNQNEEIIARCNGANMYGCTHTDQLWVDQSYRNQGLGRSLLKQVHKYGQKAGYLITTIVTMDFQCSIKFYEKLGYEKIMNEANMPKAFPLYL